MASLSPAAPIGRLLPEGEVSLSDSNPGTPWIAESHPLARFCCSEARLPKFPSSCSRRVFIHNEILPVFGHIFDSVLTSFIHR